MANNTYWISAFCFAALMLVILVKDWRWFKSPNHVARSLYILIFFTLISCLPVMIHGLCVGNVISKTNFLSPLEELSIFTSVVNFLFWINFVILYIRIRQPYSMLLLGATGLLAAVGAIGMGLDILHVGNYSETEASPAFLAWRKVAILFEETVYTVIALFAIYRIFFQHHQFKHPTRRDPRYEASAFAAIVPLQFCLLSSGNDVICSLSRATSCLILYIYVIAYEIDGLQHSKEMFLENMGHEIRTSLNSVYGFAQLLSMPEGTWSEEERQSYATHINNSYYMLDMLLNDLMVAIRYDSHIYNINVTSVNVMEVVSEAVAAIEVCMPSSVEINISSELPKGFTIQSDGQRIRQIMQNLLVNVFQHINSGKIEVHLRQVDDILEITVTASMPPTYHVADEKRLATQKDGQSMRLLICQNMAKMLKGNVIHDKSYSNGIRYLFELKNKIGRKTSNLLIAS